MSICNTLIYAIHSKIFTFWVYCIDICKFMSVSANSPKSTRQFLCNSICASTIATHPLHLQEHCNCCGSPHRLEGPLRCFCWESIMPISQENCAKRGVHRWLAQEFMRSVSSFPMISSFGADVCHRGASLGLFPADVHPHHFPSTSHGG